MSYILEALKKAQAERQLGNAPTIHAPPVAAPVASGSAVSRKPLLIGLGAGALVVAAGALWLRPAPAPAPRAVVPTTAASAARPSAPAPAPVATPTPTPTPTLEVSAPPAPPAAVPAPMHAPEHAPEHAPARAPEPTPAPAPAAAHPAPVRSAPEARPTPEARTAAPASVPAPVTKPAAAAAPAPEDSLPFLQQLPDTQQRDIPRVTFGGYMYSSNPADRLLIVDKALRHEGEEVAPGLVLEKLLPKAAVMNYRGTRYRVAY